MSKKAHPARPTSISASVLPVAVERDRDMDFRFCLLQSHVARLGALAWV